MTAVKAHAVDNFIADAGRDCPLVLIYGPDQGAVAERAAALRDTIIAAARQPPSLVTLTSDQMAGDPGRLADEAGGASLFGGDPLIRLRVTDNRHNIVPTLAALIANPPAGARIIVEAGDLKPSSGLRKAFESADRAAALPCYQPKPEETAAMIRAIVADAGKTITAEAVAGLCANLGGDRLANRNEIDKLVLYAGEAAEITLEDVQAIVGESVELRNDRLIDNALVGRPGAVESDLSRLRMEHASAAGLLTQALRQLTDLQAMRAGCDAGASPETVMSRQRPPIFFNRRPAIERAIRAWPVAELARARALVAEAILKSRRNAALDTALAADALLRIAAKAERLARR